MSTEITFATGETLLERGTIWIQFGTSTDAVRRFAQRLQPYTTASILMVSATQTEPVNLEPGGSGEFHSVRVAAHIFIRRRATSQVYGFKLLSPGDAVFNEYQEVDQGFGEQFAEWFSDLAGELFDFEHGGLTGSTE